MNTDIATIVAQMRKQLVQMDRWIDKVEADAAARKYDADVLLQARLAPNMFPLVRQYGIACDNAKLTAARLSGDTAPKHADDQKTWADVRARLRDVIGYLEAFDASRFEGAGERQARFGYLPGKHLAAEDYLVPYAVPNFLFHVSMAYALLRHNGVDLGKADYLGPLAFRDDG